MFYLPAIIKNIALLAELTVEFHCRHYEHVAP